MTEQAILTAVDEFLQKKIQKIVRNLIFLVKIWFNFSVFWPTSSWSARIHDLRKLQGKSQQRESLLDVLEQCGKDA